jgi:hypothetical protein
MLQRTVWRGRSSLVPGGLDGWREIWRRRSKLGANVETSLRDADAEAKVCHSIGRLLCGGRPKCFRGDEFGAGGEWCQSASFETPCSVATSGRQALRTTAYHSPSAQLGCQNALRVTVDLCTLAIRALLACSAAHERAHNFLLKRTCCHFAQVIGVTSDPRITFPYLLKIRASTLGLCATLAGSRAATVSVA